MAQAATAAGINTILSRGLDPSDPKVQYLVQQVRANPNILSQIGLDFKEFMALDSLVRQYERAMEKTNPPTTTVLQDRMAKLAQMQGQEDIANQGIAQVTPEDYLADVEYAGGGIVAFSEGGQDGKYVSDFARMIAERDAARFAASPNPGDAETADKYRKSGLGRLAGMSGPAYAVGTPALTIPAVASTSTEDYRKRFGLELGPGEEPTLMGDIGVRALGAASELGNIGLLGIPSALGLFRDKETLTPAPAPAPAPVKKPTAPSAKPAKPDDDEATRRLIASMFAPEGRGAPGAGGVDTGVAGAGRYEKEKKEAADTIAQAKQTVQTATQERGKKLKELQDALLKEEDYIAQERKRYEDAGVGKADAERKAKLDAQQIQLTARKETQTWFAAANAFFKMAEEGAKPGQPGGQLTRLFGAAGAGGQVFAKQVMDINDKFDTAQDRLQDAQYQLAKAEEDRKAGFIKAGSEKYRDARNAVMSAQKEYDTLVVQGAKLMSDDAASVLNRTMQSESAERIAAMQERGAQARAAMAYGGGERDVKNALSNAIRIYGPEHPVTQKLSQGLRLLQPQAYGADVRADVAVRIAAAKQVEKDPEIGMLKRRLGVEKDLAKRQVIENQIRAAEARIYQVHNLEYPGGGAPSAAPGATSAWGNMNIK